MVACSVYLYVAILGANVRICREPVVDSWECRPDDLANAGIADPGHELVLRDPSRPRLRCMCQCTCKQLTGPAAQEHHSQDGRTRPFSSVSLALPGTPPGNAARPRPPPQRGPAAGPDGISMRLHRSGPDRTGGGARRRPWRAAGHADGGSPPWAVTRPPHRRHATAASTRIASSDPTLRRLPRCPHLERRCARRSPAAGCRARRPGSPGISSPAGQLAVVSPDRAS